MMMQVDGRSALVIGAGRAGRGAIRLLVARGAHVRVLDRSPEVLAAADWPASVELRGGDDQPDTLQGIDLVVPSPGVRREHPLLCAATARGIPVWSEIELAARFLSYPILAITGTNGKSTTTVLLGAMLTADGCRVFVGGNLGTPLTDAVYGDRPYDAAVTEISSFQLEWVTTFHPRVALLLNLSPDHQDRYASVDEYGAMKAILLSQQNTTDIAVLNRDDPWVWAQRSQTRAAVHSFGRDPVELGTFLDGDEVVTSGTGSTQRYALADSPLRGEHNRENIQAAITAASAWGVTPAAIRTALRATGGLPHRLEFCRGHDGVRYYDDSKATNIGAVAKSIASFPAGIVLLLGGYDKGGNFTALRQLIDTRVTDVVCFGAARVQIADQLDGVARCRVTENLAHAVRTAADLAQPGQVVVLAPGCASFDEFTDYAQRGRHFRSLVEAL